MRTIRREREKVLESRRVRGLVGQTETRDETSFLEWPTRRRYHHYLLVLFVLLMLLAGDGRARDRRIKRTERPRRLIKTICSGTAARCLCLLYPAGFFFFSTRNLRVPHTHRSYFYYSNGGDSRRRRPIKRAPEAN